MKFVDRFPAIGIFGFEGKTLVFSEFPENSLARDRNTPAPGFSSSTEPEPPVGKSAVFTPFVFCRRKTMKNRTVPAAICLSLWFLTIAACAGEEKKRERFLNVTATSPANGSSTAGSKEEIVVEFDRPINPPAFSNLSFRREKFLNPLAYKIRADSTDDTLVAVAEENLIPGEEYRFSLNGICAAENVCMKGEHSIRFTVDFLAVESTSPAKNSFVADPSSDIVVRFKYPPVPQKIEDKIGFVKTLDDTSIDFDAGFDASGKVLTVNPLNILSTGEEYRITVAGLCTANWVCLKETFELDFGVSSPNWGSWNEVVQTAPLPKTASSISAVFKERIWTAGGIQETAGLEARTNRIYASNAEATSWTRMNPTGRVWSERTGHAAAVFDGKLWILGGEKRFFELLNDVWHSTDGTDWNEATTDASWDARYGHRAVAFANRLWLSGGFDGLNYFKDFYASADGISWRAIDATFDSAYPGRAFHGFLATDEALWILGGRGASGNLNDVWKSSDGTVWQRVTANANWSGRNSFCAFVAGNLLYVAAGKATNPLAETWKSGNGVDWVKADPVSNHPPRYAAGCSTFKNKVHLIGGRTSGSFFNDVWKMGAF